jgi:asparagine synthase (glutamine-hydrolysing)
MGFQANHTHVRSNLESLPLTDSLGNMLVFDGRLDNHAQLCALLGIRDSDTADSLIVLLAFRRWGEECFARLIGDWALALWSHLERSLYLARDHAGTRTLYFEEAKGCILWSTHLETFFTEGRSRDLEESYVACYLACQSIRDLTPYKGVRAVPPAHYLTFQEAKFFRKAHWQWILKDQIRYQADTEYDDHFLSLFGQAVERRSGPDTRALAQLSGGVDSTSIVCMSDHLRKAKNPEAQLIDTVSFYDDTDPNWDEKSYFLRVEAERGRSGIHIATASRWTFEPADAALGRYLFPGADNGSVLREKQSQTLIGDAGYRVILSGIGGDELLGGVPTPFPELADYLISLKLKRLLQQSVSWCLIERKPLAFTLFDLLRFTAGLYRRTDLQAPTKVPWVRSGSLARPIGSAPPHGEGIHSFSTRPSAISSGLTWWSLMETLPHTCPGVLTRPEFRYPYLDRDLVDFLFRVPREHLLRPGRRRLLMRRALRDITPSYILERRRKAYLARSPLAALRNAKEKISLLFDDSLAAAHDFIEPTQFMEAYDATIKSEDCRWIIPVLKTIGFELWLRSNSAAPILSKATGQ